MPNLVTVGGVVFELSRGKGSAIKQLGRQADAALHICTTTVCFNSHFPGGPVLAGTRMSPFYWN